MDANEKNLLIDKKYTCPICEKQIHAKTVKANTAKFIDTKYDLRPIHSNINITKYDAICCSYCGFASLTKNFDTTTSTQRKLIREKIQTNYKSHEETECDI